MWHHKTSTRLALALLFSNVTYVFPQIDLCDPDAAIRAADCEPLEVIPVCDYTGEWCYVYDAAEQFCPEPYEFFLPEVYGGIPAEGPPVCTTTTTTTFTVTSTTTCTTTIWTTTAPQPTECRNFCPENTHPWLVKCGWPVCASCTECSSVVLPTTELTTTIEVDLASYIDQVAADRSGNRSSNASSDGDEEASSDADDSGDSGGSSLSAALGGSSSAAGFVLDAAALANDNSLQEAAAQTIQVAFTFPPTTTEEPEESKTCLSMCYQAISSGMNWNLLCEWATCVNCPECSGTTTTTVVVPVETTITTTRTETTLYPPTKTKTTTRTRSSTTHTDTKTRTTTTTSTNRPCYSPSPVLTSLMAESDCKYNISAGDFCVAPMIDHPCVYPGDMVFECPKGNILYREPVLLSGSFQSKCKICGWADESWEDLDFEPGKFTVRLRFGANALLGEVDENSIFGYGIFLADNCSRTVRRDLVHYIPKWPEYPYDDRCCTMDAYDETFSFDAPPGYNNVSLMVRVNTSFGFLPVGAMTSEIEDWNDTSLRQSGARRSADVAGFNSYMLALLSGVLVLRASSL